MVPSILHRNEVCKSWFWNVKKQERETLKARSEQEDLLFICLVCSLQAALKIFLALISFPTLQISDRLSLRGLSCHRNHKMFVCLRRIPVVSCDLVRRQKAAKTIQNACFCSCWSLWLYCREYKLQFFLFFFYYFFFFFTPSYKSR